MFNDYNNLFFMLQPTNDVEEALLKKQNYLWTWYSVLSNIICGIFKYDNMPIPLIKRVNQSFFNSAYVCAFNDDLLGVVVTPCEPIGVKNSWGEYAGYVAVLPDGKQKSITLNDCVIGTNYFLQSICDSLMCYQFAYEIAELKLSIDNAIVLCRNSAMLEVPNENALNEALDIFNKHRIGTPVTVVKKRPEDEYKTLEFLQPTKINDYYDCLRNLLNEFLTVTGLSSLNNPNKKERLITDEVNSNEDIKNTLLANRIENRVNFINDINKKFGTNYNVSVSDNVYNIDDILNKNL